MSGRTWKNHQILQKLFENEENLVIFTIILMAAFGTKNVHSTSLMLCERKKASTRDFNRCFNRGSSCLLTLK